MNLSIFPDQTGTGVVQKEFFADRIGERIKGFAGFQARESVPLYYNGRYWTLQRGAFFGVSPKHLQKRTINK